VTSIVNTIRDLLAQQPVGDDIWIALAWCVGLLAIALAWCDGQLPAQDRLNCRTNPLTKPKGRPMNDFWTKVLGDKKEWRRMS
jgi:hypothetical protein